MKDRIRQIMESQQMSQQEFAQKLELSPASLSSIFTGRTNPTNKHAQAIHKAFPKVNINWLMFGEGEMYSEAAILLDVDSETELENSPLSEFGHANDKDRATATAFQPLLFDSQKVGNQDSSLRRREKERENDILKAKEIEIARRAIKEIRVFYDDGTYESFSPSK
ncbi:MAG: helix-turn-helix transcriptional regulator [Bacteroidaceae bacterium]